MRYHPFTCKQLSSVDANIRSIQCLWPDMYATSLIIVLQVCSTMGELFRMPRGRSFSMVKVQELRWFPRKTTFHAGFDAWRQGMSEKHPRNLIGFSAADERSVCLRKSGTMMPLSKYLRSRCCRRDLNAITGCGLLRIARFRRKALAKLPVACVV